MGLARRALAIAAVALALHAASAAGFRPPIRVAPPVYLIEGYVDRAPDESKVIDRVDVTAPNEKVRWLLVTSYRGIGGMLLDRYLSRSLRHPWLLRGKPEEIARLLEAPAGTAFEGTFLVYEGGVPSLFVADLDEPPA